MWTRRSGAAGVRKGDTWTLSCRHLHLHMCGDLGGSPRRPPRALDAGSHAPVPRPGRESVPFDSRADVGLPGSGVWTRWGREKARPPAPDPQVSARRGPRSPPHPSGRARSPRQGALGLVLAGAGGAEESAAAGGRGAGAPHRGRGRGGEGTYPPWGCSGRPSGRRLGPPSRRSPRLSPMPRGWPLKCGAGQGAVPRRSVAWWRRTVGAGT